MKNISKYFAGVKALDNAQLRVRSGSVHAIIGENGAGKSTLMKCLFGIYKKDSGEIIFNNKSVEFNSPRDALDNSISMVDQEVSLVPERNAMENIWLGRFPQKGLIVDEKQMYKRVKEIFSELSINIDPKQKVSTLSSSEKQIVAIARALSINAKVIVLDEPTSSLAEKEVNHLFKIINALKSKGCAIIYISHKIEEIFKIADEVTIMRDGKHIITEKTKNLKKQKAIALMVGRKLDGLFPPKENTPTNNIILSVKNLTGVYGSIAVDVSFDLFEGEILGIAGLMGSGRTEMLETLFGIRKQKSGEIYVKGKRVENLDPRKSNNNGFALVTEDRRDTGIFGELNVNFNSIIANIKNYCNPIGIVNEKKTTKDTKWVIDFLKVKTPSQKTHIAYLSGGNQQKVIIGRWLLTNSDILMLDEPTKGIDIGAKYEIYQLMIEIVKNGKGIIFNSSEMPELLGIADRILVMNSGRVAGIVNSKDTNQEELMHIAYRFL